MLNTHRDELKVELAKNVYEYFRLDCMSVYYYGLAIVLDTCVLFSFLFCFFLFAIDFPDHDSNKTLLTL
jgi:hypothetical protein